MDTQPLALHVVLFLVHCSHVHVYVALGHVWLFIRLLSSGTTFCRIGFGTDILIAPTLNT